MFCVYFLPTCIDQLNWAMELRGLQFSFSMSCVHVREGISKAITMLTPFISSLMGCLIVFLHTMRVMVSYSTSMCISSCGLRPPCFHPGVSRLRSRQYRIYRPSIHPKLFEQRLPKRKSNECFAEDMQKSDRAASINTVYDDEEAARLLVERENSLKVFPENLINGHASHEHVSAIGSEHDLIVLSDGAKDDTIIITDDAQDGVKNDVQTPVEHVCGSARELGFFQPLKELLESNARPTDGASPVSEVGLDSRKEILANKLDVPACMHPQSFQEMQQEGSDLEVSASKRFGYELDAHEMQKVMSSGLDDVPLKLKQMVSAQRQALDTVHGLLERQRMASSLAAQESMAMISSLQKEKAALCLEAMQHQRMAEEKEMFDENALIDLRDSLVKREAELLALEKEMELYRRFFFLKDQAATIEQKKVKTGVSTGESTVQQHSMLEYPVASRGTETGQHANLSRECRNSIHPLSSISTEASTLNPCSEMSAVNRANIQWGSPDLRSRSMIVRDTSRVSLKKEALELLSRLQAVEGDREMMRQTLELRKKERWELRLLQEVVGALKSLQLSSGKRTTIGLHRACSVSAVEAEIFRSKRPRCMEQ